MQLAIEFREEDLFEVFLSEPESLSGNPGDCEIRYQMQDSYGLELQLWILTYREECDVFVKAGGRDVFSGEFADITSIERRDGVLALKRGNSDCVTLLLGDGVHVLVNGV